MDCHSQRVKPIICSMPYYLLAEARTHSSVVLLEKNCYLSKIKVYEVQLKFGWKPIKFQLLSFLIFRAEQSEFFLRNNLQPCSVIDYGRRFHIGVRNAANDLEPRGFLEWGIDISVVVQREVQLLLHCECRIHGIPESGLERDDFYLSFTLL